MLYVTFLLLGAVKVSLCTEYFIRRSVDARGPEGTYRSPRPKDSLGESCLFPLMFSCMETVQCLFIRDLYALLFRYLATAESAT
jgi:hypothetical protein